MINKKVRIYLYEEANKTCQYCGCNIEYKEMQIDHITSKYNNGKDEQSNYRVSCRQCNFYKGTKDIDIFRSELLKLVPRLQKIFIFRLALKYKLITINKVENIQFEFEKKE